MSSTINKIIFNYEFKSTEFEYEKRIKEFFNNEIKNIAANFGDRYKLNYSIEEKSSSYVTLSNSFECDYYSEDLTPYLNLKQTVYIVTLNYSIFDCYISKIKEFTEYIYFRNKEIKEYFDYDTELTTYKNNSKNLYLKLDAFLIISSACMLSMNNFSEEACNMIMSEIEHQTYYSIIKYNYSTKCNFENFNCFLSVFKEFIYKYLFKDYIKCRDYLNVKSKLNNLEKINFRNISLNSYISCYSAESILCFLRLFLFACSLDASFSVYEPYFSLDKNKIFSKALPFIYSFKRENK